MSQSSPLSYHRSIFLQELLAFATEALHQTSFDFEQESTGKNKSSRSAPFWIMDGTLGDAGHSLALLKHIPQACLIGLDQDPVMLGRARKRLEQAGISCLALEKDRMKSFFYAGQVKEKEECQAKAAIPMGGPKSRAILVNENFSKGAAVLDALQIQVHFVLLDVGVSEFHFRFAKRGFSYLDEKLDMRLDPGAARTAREVLNTYSEHDLKKIFSDYGEERFAGRIARSIAESRPIESARELAEIVQRAVPTCRSNSRRKVKNKKIKKRKRDPSSLSPPVSPSPASLRIHPATRVFQAIRLEVNQELQVLEKALKELPMRLARGGRLAVISFHSLEDRIVKRAFLEFGSKKPKPKTRQSNKKLYKQKIHKKESEKGFYILTPKPLRPSLEEIALNPSARSAKLRVMERRCFAGLLYAEGKNS